MDRDRSIANMCIDIRIRVLVSARSDFPPDVVVHSRLRRDLARNAHAGAQRTPIGIRR